MGIKDTLVGFATTAMTMVPGNTGFAQSTQTHPETGPAGDQTEQVASDKVKTITGEECEKILKKHFKFSDPDGNVKKFTEMFTEVPIEHLGVEFMLAMDEVNRQALGEIQKRGGFQEVNRYTARDDYKYEGLGPLEITIRDISLQNVGEENRSENGSLTATDDTQYSMLEGRAGIQIKDETHDLDFLLQPKNLIPDSQRESILMSNEKYGCTVSGPGLQSIEFQKVAPGQDATPTPGAGQPQQQRRQQEGPGGGR